MSNLTTRPDAHQVVLKPSTYQSGNTRGGLNLNKWIPKFLKKIGFADTADPNCCQYFPIAPTILVTDISNPTEEEMANVPIKGFFYAEDSDGIWNLYVKVQTDSVSEIIATND